MPFDASKYLGKSKKRTFAQKIKIKWYLYKKKNTKKFAKFFKVIWEIIYYSIIYLVGISFVYDSYTTVQVSQGLLAFALLFTLVQHKSIKEQYKIWESMQDDDFYYCFTKSYKPLLLLPQLILLFILAKFCSVGAFIILFVAMYTYDLWDRRYITHDIKHDMILKELKKINRS